MSYAGVESEEEYMRRRIADIDRERARAAYELTPQYREEQKREARAKKERQLKSARDSIVQHEEAIKQARERIKLLEKELAE